jgi:hypothetical protein
MLKVQVMIKILLAGAMFALANSSIASSVSDGPYISVAENTYQVEWVCNSKANKEVVKLTQPINFAKCGLFSNVNSLKNQNFLIEYKGDYNVAALSDFHGQYDLMMSILKRNGIVNDKEEWAFGNGHFVITGDVFDRGDKVTEILWFIYQLERQAEKAGGRVHLLLGNHEVMVLNGDLRYLHPKYVEVARILNRPFEDLVSKGTILGDWLRSKPVLVKINNMLFAHGGFHPELAKEKRTLDEINQVFKKSLIKSELTKPRAGFAQYLHKRNGPIWYRGYFKDDGASEAEIELLLKHFDIEHLIVGHTSQKQVEKRFDGKVIAIDTSIKKGKYGEVLLIESGKMFRGTPQGKRIALN